MKGRYLAVSNSGGFGLGAGVARCGEAGTVERRVFDDADAPAATHRVALLRSTACGGVAKRDVWSAAAGQGAGGEGHGELTKRSESLEHGLLVRRGLLVHGASDWFTAEVGNRYARLCQDPFDDPKP